MLTAMPEDGGMVQVRYSALRGRYEAVQLGERVGWLEIVEPGAMTATATAAGSSWRFEVRRLGRWSWVGAAFEDPGGRMVGTYRPVRVLAARIEIGDASYVLRRPWLTDVWKLRRREGDEKAAIRFRANLKAPTCEFELDTGIGGPRFPLLVLLTVWGLLLEPNFVSGGGG
jgi:hypothetical protein